MSKENYKSSDVLSGGSCVIKRSPSVSGRKHSKTTGNSILGKSRVFRNSMVTNINSLNRLLNESEKILPRTK